MGNGIQEYDHVVAALHQTLCLFQHDAGHLNMPLSRLVESRGHHLGLDTAGHVRNLLRTLVYQKHYHIDLWMIVRYGIGYGL